MYNQNLAISLQHTNKIQQTLTITHDNWNVQHPYLPQPPVPHSYATPYA
jgi:hypothetical protein